MKRFLTYALAVVMALGLTGTVYANICATDVEPAATLLFPFVQYDYEGGVNGENTLFAITNVSSEAAIVHITVWTDYSIAILDFNLTLTGYDVQTISIRDILKNGVLPHDSEAGGYANEWWDGTGPSDDPPGPGSNAGGTPFAAGPFSPYNELWLSALDGYFGTSGLPAPEPTGPWNAIDGFVMDCDPDDWISSPVNYADPIPQGTLDIFQGYLQSSQLNTTAYSTCAWSGSQEFNGGTWFTNQDPRATWMYITADVVGACNKELPDGATDYFNPGATTGLRNDNQLIGDLIWVDPANNFSEADNAVHIEAVDGLTDGTATINGTPFATTPIPGTAKDTTFYARHHLGALQTSWVDDREPLPSAWAFRYVVADAADVSTSIRAFKASTVFRVNDDLRGPDVDPAPDGDGVYDRIDGTDPAELWANTCYAYTYYAWDMDENVNSVEAGFEPPWSGGPGVDPVPVPNLLPLETQEVDATQFFLVGSPDAAFGWVMFVWPNSNNTATYGLTDHYQTWMGVRYGYGSYSAALSGAVMANYSCDDTEVLPILGLVTVD